MRLIIETEKEEDLDQLKEIFKIIDLSSLNVSIKSVQPDREKKIRDFILFTKSHAIKVDEIIIPDREERNAR